MSKLTDEERKQLRVRLTEIETEMAGMTGTEKRDYLVAKGYVSEMSDEDVERNYGGYGHTTITSIGAPKLSIARGDVIMVQELSGRWQNRMVAMGGGMT